MTLLTGAEQPSVTPPPRPAPRPTTQMTIGCLVIPVLLLLAISVVMVYTWYTAATSLTVPDGDVLLVRTQPVATAPLVARFGAGQVLPITGRSADWRWLAVKIGEGQQGWARRPLDILVWQLRAEPQLPAASAQAVVQITPVAEEMVTLAGGVFTMGSPPGIGEADETPAHTIELAPFAMDRTEVTVGQYWECVQAGVCGAPTGQASSTALHYLNDVAFDNYPVIYVPWSDAQAYCTWRGKRLPTEAEWEMAAGWDATRNAKLTWPWGNDPAAQVANTGGRQPDSAPVGGFPGDLSPAGLLDMGGNVREWVLDWYKVDYYQVTDNTNPTGPSNRKGDGSGRVVRGAAFADPVEQARTANRDHAEPAYGYPTIGFRCVQVVDGK